jgi:hypothetical protein
VQEQKTMPLKQGVWKGTWLEAQVFYVIDVRATRLKKE